MKDRIAIWTIRLTTEAGQFTEQNVKMACIEALDALDGEVVSMVTKKAPVKA